MMKMHASPKTSSSQPTRPPWFLLWLAVLFLPACVTGTKPALSTASQLPEVPQEIPVYGGPRRVVVSKAEQRLRAYDGDRLVFETRVSTGREGKQTPGGSFRALDKERMHHSSLYENAPMPYSVRFQGNYFLHGYSSVPLHPASHGCIRLPLNADQRHPARMFYQWIEIGTPIRVTGDWQG